MSEFNLYAQIFDDVNLSRTKKVQDIQLNTNMNNRIMAQPADLSFELESAGPNDIWNRDIAQNSAFYGKKLAGYVYNPYMVRRFLPAKFIRMVNESDGNINNAIKSIIGLKDAKKIVLDELVKLAKLESTDRIAFEERSKIWTIRRIQDFYDWIFRQQIKVLRDALKYVEANKKDYSFVKIPGVGRLSIRINKSIVGRKNKVVYKATYTHDIIPVITRWRENLCEVTHHSYEALLSTITAYETEKRTRNLDVKIFMTRDIILRDLFTDEIDIKTEVVSHARHQMFTNNALPGVFIEPYKLAGAYYTLKNFIIFDNWIFEGLRGKEAVDLLREYLDSGKVGYEFYAMFKKAAIINASPLITCTDKLQYREA